MAGSQQEIIIPADIPLVQELGATLREWAQIWHKLFVVCTAALFGHTWFGWTFEGLTFIYDALHPCGIIEETAKKAPLVQC